MKFVLPFGFVCATMIYSSIAAQIELPLAGHIVAYYPFCGSANDVSGLNNNPSSNNATLSVDRFGHPNSAYSFDGTQYIQGSCSNYPAHKRTISIWYKINDVVHHNTLFGYAGGVCGTSYYEFVINGYGIYGHCFGTPGCGTANSVQAAVWKNLIVTTGNDTTKIFEDGVLTSSCNNNVGSSTDVAGKVFVFGTCIAPSGQGPFANQDVDYLIGALDDIVIYDTVLNENEVNQLYNSFANNTSNCLLTMYYRSRQTGNWNDVNSWESSLVADFSRGVISPALVTPDADNSYSVFVRRPHVVTVTVDVISSAITVDSKAGVQVNQGIHLKVVP